MKNENYVDPQTTLDVVERSKPSTFVGFTSEVYQNGWGVLVPKITVIPQPYPKHET